MPALAKDEQTNSAVGIDPYYTGSLLSPSPAVPRAGLIAFEPYVIENINPGKYGTRGGLSPVTDVTSTTGTFTLIKYGITDHLTIDVNPQTQINQDEKTGYLPDSMYHHGFGTLALAESYGQVDEGLLWEGGKPVRSIGAASSGRDGTATPRPGMSRRTPTALSLWKCPPKPFW